ncbi:hypothetical protein FKW77_000122 [Venturia effusa]|uniref:Glycosyltransferase family 8 protein n=1 Tax=Venturia effusa TaxID=50376 RepID=A0A517L6I7_9PEZI|nr:hypothetical protein FKW77_000122 [Venturia effusa]
MTTASVHQAYKSVDSVTASQIGLRPFRDATDGSETWSFSSLDRHAGADEAVYVSIGPGMQHASNFVGPPIDTNTKWEPVDDLSIHKPAHDALDLAIPTKDDSTKPFAFFADGDPSSTSDPTPIPQATAEGPVRHKPVPPSQPENEHGRGESHRPRYAIVTSVWDHKYASLALMLGWSIKKHNDLRALGVELVLLTLRGGNLDDATVSGITEQNRTRLEKVGWKIRAEERMQIPQIDYSRIQPHRRLNLNKLKIFGWAEYDKIVFLDADTIVKGSIEELFTMPGDFAAAPDVWHDIPHDPRFNSGVMVFRPRRWLFDNMIEKLANPDYHDPTQSDQAFLQKYWEYKSWGLPSIYNLNLVMYEAYRTSWDQLWMNTRIVHFTIRKPVEAWAKEGQCRKPTGKPNERSCALWPALTWYGEAFKQMRQEMGLEKEIGLLGVSTSTRDTVKTLPLVVNNSSQPLDCEIHSQQLLNVYASEDMRGEEQEKVVLQMTYIPVIPLVTY